MTLLSEETKTPRVASILNYPDGMSDCQLLISYLCSLSCLSSLVICGSVMLVSGVVFEFNPGPLACPAPSSI